MNEIKKFEDLKVGDKVLLRSDLDLGGDYQAGMIHEIFVRKGEYVEIQGFGCPDLPYFTCNSEYLSDGTHVFLSNDMIDWDKPTLGSIEPEHDLTVKFAKTNPNAIIPSKIDEDAGFDLYACFNQNDLIINVGETLMIPTGIKSSYPLTHMALIKERGSTGSKAMSVKAGVMDSGFRNEWKVLINNTNTKPILITKETNEYIIDELKNTYVVYPYKKAIAQFLFIPVPRVKVLEVDFEEIDSDESIRGNGMLGSSGK